MLAFGAAVIVHGQRPKAPIMKSWKFPNFMVGIEWLSHAAGAFVAVALVIFGWAFNAQATIVLSPPSGFLSLSNYYGDLEGLANGSLPLSITFSDSQGSATASAIGSTAQIDVEGDATAGAGISSGFYFVGQPNTDVTVFVSDSLAVQMVGASDYSTCASGTNASAGVVLYGANGAEKRFLCVITLSHRVVEVSLLQQ